MAVIDLSQLPAPEVIEVPDFETLLTERKEALIALYPADEQAAIRRVLTLESDPLVKSLQESDYREILLRQRINEAAQAVMVAYALGSDLDQLAAAYNVGRLTVTAADTEAVPPVDAVMESDDALRLRVPAAFEGLSVAGPTAAYEFHARSADGRVSDVSATSPAPAEVVITVLSREDDRGFEADQLDIELDDADGQLQLPRRGVVLSLALGWQGQMLTPKGNYTVDEIEHTSAPDRLVLRARSADFRETLNTRREKSWHDTTVGDMVKEIAARHKLEMALSDDVAKVAIDHLDQTNESDASFLMRLARQCGAIACIKNGNLLFIRQGQGKTASGKVLPVMTLQRKDGDSHRFTLADRDAYTGVIASWLHTREPEKKEVTKVKRRRKTSTATKKEPEAKQGDYLIGTDENVLVLSRTYATRANAERAAKMQWERLQRGVATFSIQLARGRADLYTEMPVKVSGFKQQIDGGEWIITTLTHSLSDIGFTTSMDLEVKIDSLEME